MLPYVIILIAAAIYFLPTIIAMMRNHHQTGMVFVIDLFFGWSLIGWVIALAIAASATRKPI